MNEPNLSRIVSFFFTENVALANFEKIWLRTNIEDKIEITKKVFYRFQVLDNVFGMHVACNSSIGFVSIQKKYSIKSMAYLNAEFGG